MSSIKAKLSSIIRKIATKPAVDLAADLNVASLRSTAHLMALEPRIALDAAAVATGLEVLTDDVAAQDQPSTGESSIDSEDELAAALIETTDTNSSHEIVFIDSAVDDYQSIIAEIDPSIEVVVLDADRDGVEQMAEVLSNYDDVDAIHIISHGDKGELRLGNATLDSDSITGEHADELEVIRDALSQDGDILLYGCNFSEGEEGANAVADLAAATGADIAASDDLTGSQELGGDWDLETTSGSVETAIAVDIISQQSWHGVLADSVIFSTDFEGAAGTGHVAAPYAGWGSDDGQIEIWQEPTNGWTTPDGTTYIELNDDPGGTFPDSSDINRTVNTIAGVTYEISFIWSGRPGFNAAVNSMTFSVDGAVQGTYTHDATGLTDHAWTTTTVSFVGTGSPVELSFDATGTPVAGGRGMRIDDIELVQLNQTPDAVDDAAATVMNTAVNNVDVISNDSDGDGEALSVLGTPTALNGTVTVNVDNTINYTPDPGYSGSDTITYTVTDGAGGTGTASVTVSVSATPGAPVAIVDAGSTFDGVTTSGNVIANDTDPDGDPLTVSAVSGLAGNVGTSVAGSSGGTFTINSDGSYVFDPAGDFSGLAAGVTATTTVTYTVSDGVSSDTTTVTITVTGDSGWSITGTSSVTEGGGTTYTINLDEVIAAGNTASIDLSLVDIDTNSSDYANFIAAVNTAVASRSDLTFDGTTLTYTAPSDYTIVQDLSTSNFNDISGTGTALGLGDDASSAQAIGFDFDFYGTNYTNLNVGSNGFVTFGGGSGDYTNEDFTAGQNLDNLPAIAVLWDDWNPAAGGSDDVYVETIGTAPNRQFIIQWNDIVEYSGADPVTFQLVINETDSSFEMRYSDVQATHADDGASATIGIHDGGTTYQQFSFNSASIGDDSHITFTPPGGEMTDLVINLATVDDAIAEGDEDFQITLSNAVNSNLTANSSQTTTIDDNDNSPPVAVADTASTNEDTSVTITGATIVANDTDVDGDTLSVTAVTNGTNGTASVVAGNVVYIPNLGFNGTDTLTYTISDGNGATDTASITITINAVNDDPIAVADTSVTNEDVTKSNINILGNDTDPDGDTVSLVGIPSATHGTVTVNANGTINYMPDAGYHGTDTITYMISDGNGGTDTATLTMLVKSVNDGPVARNDATFTNAGETRSNINILGNDSDADGDKLSVLGVPKAVNGTVTVNANGTINYTPDAGFSGTDTISYAISDGNGGTDSATITVTVNPANDNLIDGLFDPTAKTIFGQRQERETASDDNDLIIDHDKSRVIVRAVQEIGNLGHLSDIDGEKLIILETVNQIESLEGFGDSQHGKGHVIAAVNEIARQGIFARSGLTGEALGGEFAGASVRWSADRPANSSSETSSNDRLKVEMLSDAKTLLLQVSHIQTDGTDIVAKDYGLTLADGRVLPKWIEKTTSGLFIGEIPADTPILDVKLSILMDDNTVMTEYFSINAGSGQINVTEPIDSAQSARLFSQQLTDTASVEEKNSADLARMLAQL